MLPSTMQGDSEELRCSSEIGNDKFEEMVRTSKLIRHFAAIIVSFLIALNP